MSQFKTASLAINGSGTAIAAGVNEESRDGEERESSTVHHSLKQFLCQDIPLLLMLCLQVVGLRVGVNVF